MLPGLAPYAVRWIHSSIASRLRLLSEISHPQLFDAFHGGVKNTTFWLTRDAYDTELRTERGKCDRNQCSRQIVVRNATQLKIVVELLDEFCSASIVVDFFDRRSVSAHRSVRYVTPCAPIQASSREHESRIFL